MFLAAMCAGWTLEDAMPGPIAVETKNLTRAPSDALPTAIDTSTGLRLNLFTYAL